MSNKKNQNLFWALFVGGAILFIVILAIMKPGVDRDTSLSGDSTVEITVAEDDWTLGNPDALVTLVEYADFQCPACAAYHPIIKEVVEQYGDQVQFVYRHFPLSFHPNATPAAQAAEAAGRQGKFWEMSDLLYARQTSWSNVNNPRGIFEDYATELELDLDQFTTDYASSEVRNKVQRDLREANNLRLGGTPTFILDNRVLQSAPGTVDGFGSLIEQRIRFIELLGDTTDETEDSAE